MVIIMNEFNKKWTTITGGLLLSGGLLFLICGIFISPTQEDVKLETAQGDKGDIVATTPQSEVNLGETVGTSTSQGIILTDANGNVLEGHPDPNITIPLPGTMNGDDQGTQQSIQPDVPEKPTYTEEQLTDPTQTPSGGKVTVSSSGEIVAEKAPTTSSSQTTTTESPPEIVILPESVTENQEAPSTETPSETEKQDSTSSTVTTPPSTSTSGTNSNTSSDSTSGGNEGMAYVPGFGWVPQTGPTEVIQATDMYENGNKVGSM